MRTDLSEQLARTMLRFAAFLVPVSRRQEWLAEWYGELFQILRNNDAGVPKWNSPMRFALGSFLDASWNRKDHLNTSLRAAPLRARPGTCLVALGVLSATTALTFLALPNLRHQVFPPSFRGPHDLQVLSRNSSLRDAELQISGRDYQSWSDSKNPSLERSVYYQPDITVLRTSAQSKELMIAWIDSVPPLFPMEPISSAVRFAQHSGRVPLILSYGLWKNQFGGDSHVIGRRVRIGGQQAIITGVAPQWAADLPGSIAAWGIVTSQKLKAVEAQRFAYGYVLTQTPIPLFRNHSGGTSLIVHGPDGVTDRMEVVSLSALAKEHRKRILQSFIGSGENATLLMPVILCIWPISFASFGRHYFRILGFLSVKLVLLLPLVYCIPLGAAALCAGSQDAAIGLQAVTSYAAVLAATYWCLRDQSQRCPHCLRLLTNPVHVGEPSRSFLAWSGTELICGNGHGVLHVPDYSTSWYPGARWLSLGISWKHLFQG